MAGAWPNIRGIRAAAATAAAMGGVLHSSMIHVAAVARSLCRRPGTGARSLSVATTSVSTTTSRAAIATMCQRRWGPHQLTAKWHGDD